MTEYRVLGVAGLVCFILILLDARNSIIAGEFRFAGRLRFMHPILKSERPGQYWLLVITWLGVGILALSLALWFLTRGA
jgi:hypothetical protein